MAVKWTAEQQKVIDARDRNLLVSAAAGSGKTAVLVERILAMVKDPVRPIDIDQLLVVTFTRAAAGEMKERIGRALQQSLEENPENEHLQRQQTLLHHAQISTIHGFCSYVIKNYFQMIDLDPVYRMADEGEIRLMKSDVIQKIMEERFAEKDPAFIRFVESYAAGKQDDGLDDLVLKLYEFSMSYPWPEQWLEECRAAYQIDSPEAVQASIWVQELMIEAKKRELGTDDLAKVKAALDGDPAWKELHRQFEEATAKIEASRKATLKTVRERITPKDPVHPQKPISK